MSYTPHDLDRMRDAIRRVRTPWSQESVERELHTLMMNGTTPDEAEAWADAEIRHADLKRQWRDAEQEFRQRTCDHSWFDVNAYLQRNGYPPRFYGGDLWQCRVCELQVVPQPVGAVA